MTAFRAAVSLLVVASLALASAASAASKDRVLIFTKTAGFRHDAIPTAVATLRALAEHRPSSPAELDGITGIGAKKRDAYGAAVLAVIAAAG